MYFLRVRRMPFTTGVLIGLFLPLPEPYAHVAHLWGFICMSVILVEHLLTVALCVRWGGWKEGVQVAGRALFSAGLTLPEFNLRVKEVNRRVREEWEQERRLAAERAATQQAAKRALLEERARRYVRRLSRLIGADDPGVAKFSHTLAQLDQAAAEVRLARVQRLAGFLEQARPLGEQHVVHLEQLFSQGLSPAEQDSAAQTYLTTVRRTGVLLEEARLLGVQGEVAQTLEHQGEEAAHQVLVHVRARVARHLELQQLKADVDRTPAHDRGHLNELLAVVKAQLADPRQFRKAVYTLRQALPQNGHNSLR
ncbi:MAG: hypothetical protein AAB558_02950 [Patescibacteria group bacterium]